MAEVHADAAPLGVDVAPLVQMAQDQFDAVLCAIPEPKTLLIDPTLASPLGLMTDLASLRQRGVERMFWMEEVPCSVNSVRIQAPTHHLLYLCRPETRWMRTVTAHYAADRDATPVGDLSYAYTIAFVPHRTEPCMHYLREHGDMSAVQILDLGLEFFVLSNDVLSLEDAHAWSDVFLRNQHAPLFHAAQALMTLQRMWGMFPRIVGKGDMANRMCDILVQQRQEALASDEDPLALHTRARDIDALIVLDRTLDLASPLMTQLTYEGLIDEVLGIKSGYVDVDASWVGGAQSSGTGAHRKVRLDGNNDALFHAIRDENFATVGEKLHATAKQLSTDYEGRHHAQTVQELRAFVNRLGTLQSGHASLRLHTCITEHLLRTTNADRFHCLLEIQQNLVAGAPLTQQLQAIEELVDLGVPPLDVLRVACLASYIHGGVKAAWLESFWTLFVHAYGYSCLPQLMALERMRILYATPSSSKAPRTSRFLQVAKPLRLMDDDVNERAPEDISYVYSGYAPLSIRLVQTITQHDHTLRERQKSPQGYPNAARIAGWHGVDEAVLRLPGATFDFMPLDDDDTPPLPDENVRTTIVFFVGGVTHAEIAALRLMSKQQRTRRFLIATTSVINGYSMLRDLHA